MRCQKSAEAIVGASTPHERHLTSNLKLAEVTLTFSQSAIKLNYSKATTDIRIFRPIGDIQLLKLIDKSRSVAICRFICP